MIFSFFKLESKDFGGFPKEVFKKIESDLSLKTNLNLEYFDSFLSSYPNSNYLISMKLYYAFYNISRDTSFKLYNSKYADKLSLSNDTYCFFVKGLFTDDNNLKRDYYYKSINVDKYRINKWVVLELYYLLDSNKEFVEAFKLLDKLLEMDKSFPIAVIEKSNKLIEKGKFTNALEILNSLEKQYPEYIYTYFSKADIYKELGNDVEVEKNYKKILYIDSNNIEAYTNLSYFFKSKCDYQKALKYISKAKNLTQGDASVFGLMGSIYLDLKDTLNAKEYLQKSIETEYSYEFSTELIYLYILTNNLNKANEILEKTISLYKRDVKLFMFQILIFHLEKREYEANRLINQFYKTFTEKDLQWLISELSKWNITISY